MRESIGRYATIERFISTSPTSASVASVLEQHFEPRSFSDVSGSEIADECEHLWVELGGEG